MAITTAVDTPPTTNRPDPADGVDPAADWVASGVMWLTGHADGPPLVPPGRAATIARQITAHLANATQGTLNLDGAGLLSERAAYTGHHRQGQISAGGSCRLLPTADGWAAISCARPDDPNLLAALIGDHLPTDPWPAVTTWLATHTNADLTNRATLLGLAAAPLPPTTTNSASRPSRFPHPTAPSSHADRAAPSSSGSTHEGSPAPATPLHTPPLPQPGPARSVTGLLVVDFSALWAGPLCAHLLGLAGAHVVKVETPQRPDGARHGNPGFYQLLHAGHRSVVLDPITPDGRRALAELVRAAGIVIEASRPRALARFGLDAAAEAASGTTWISITAYGREHDRVGFGDDVAAASGLVAHDDNGNPVFCGDAIADPLTGLFAAELALCPPSGNPGVLLDIAMSSVVKSTLDSHTFVPNTTLQSGHWIVNTPSGPTHIAQPTRRPNTDHQFTGRAPDSGEHTHEVLTELGITPP